MEPAGSLLHVITRSIGLISALTSSRRPFGRGDRSETRRDPDRRQSPPRATITTPGNVYRLSPPAPPSLNQSITRARARGRGRSWLRGCSRRGRGRAQRGRARHGRAPPPSPPQRRRRRPCRRRHHLLLVGGGEGAWSWWIVAIISGSSRYLATASGPLPGSDHRHHLRVLLRLEEERGGVGIRHNLGEHVLRRLRRALRRADDARRRSAPRRARRRGRASPGTARRRPAASRRRGTSSARRCRAPTRGHPALDGVAHLEAERAHRLGAAPGVSRRSLNPCVSSAGSRFLPMKTRRTGAARPRPTACQSGRPSSCAPRGRRTAATRARSPAPFIR